MAQRNVSNLTISILGLLNTSGGLYQVRDSSNSRETKLSMVCPSCHNSLLNQVYQCQAGCKPDANVPGKSPDGWTVREVGGDRVRVEGKNLIPVSAAEIEAAKAGTLAKGELEISVHPAAEVEAHTYPAGNTYCFVPSKADDVYTLLLEAVTDQTKAFIGIINMRDTEKLYRLQAYEGTLRVVELLRPEETAQFAPVATPTVDAKKRATFSQIVSTLEDAFDPDTYESDRLPRLKALLASKSGNATAAVAAIKKATPKIDALEAALAAAKAAKAAKAS
jgi:non-homologous end joining protein Ku